MSLVLMKVLFRGVRLESQHISDWAQAQQEKEAPPGAALSQGWTNVRGQPSTCTTALFNLLLFWWVVIVLAI